MGVAIVLLAVYSLVSTSVSSIGHGWQLGVRPFYSLNQVCGMFVPAPLKQDGWFVVEGTLASGEPVDLLRRGRPLSFQKPKSVIAMYESSRWRNYMFKFYRVPRQQDDRLLNYGRYLCEQWNQSEDAKADSPAALVLLARLAK